MIAIGPLLVGLGILALELGWVCAAAWLVLRRAGPGLDGVMLVLGYAIVAVAILLAVHLAPGALGILDRWTVLAAAGLAWLLALAYSRGATSAAARTGAGAAGQRGTLGCAPVPPTPDPTGTAGLLAWGAALGVAGLAAGYALVLLLHRFGTPPTGIDTLTFHLPDVAGWMRTGSLWQIEQYVPQLANGNYPNNGDILFLALMLPLRSVILVRAAMLAPLLLLATALYALGRQLGASRPYALLFATSVGAVPAVIDPALIETQTDTLMLFGFAAGAAFLLRHRSLGARSDLVLAGVALGISLGTKWYGVVCVPALIFLWAVATGLKRRRVRPVLVDGARLAGLTALFGGFWLLRNLLESADPVFPLRVAPLGLTLFDAPPDIVAQRANFTIADYLNAPHILSTYILPALRSLLSWSGMAIAAVALAGTAVALRDRLGRRPHPGTDAEGPAGGAARFEVPIVLTVALTALVMAAIYLVTPYSALGPRNLPAGTGANVRYLMPAVIAAAPMGAWLCTRLPCLGVAIALAMLAAAWPSLVHTYGFSSGSAGAAGLLVVAAGLAWRLRARLPRPSRLQTRMVAVQRAIGRVVPGGAGVLLTAAVFAVTLTLTLAVRPRSAYAVYAQGDATLAWILEHAPAGHRIGLAGVWSNGLAPVFPATGPSLGNQVLYVGPWRQHMLQQYGSAAAFDAALRRGRVDILLVGLGFPVPRASVPQEAWARHGGLRKVAQSDRLALFALPPRASRTLPPPAGPR